MKNLPIAHRKALEADKAFIADSYIRSSRTIVNITPGADKSYSRGFFKGRRKRLETLEARSAQFTVAYDTEEPEHIIGWICHEGPILHYIFIKKHYRGMRVARKLFEEAFAGVTHGPIYATTTSCHGNPFFSAFKSTLKYIGLDS